MLLGVTPEVAVVADEVDRAPTQCRYLIAGVWGYAGPKTGNPFLAPGWAYRRLWELLIENSQASHIPAID